MTGGKPTGIVVHSTGANNKNIKRYVQPLKTDADYSTIIADIGVNRYGNDWNRSASEMGRSVCVHAFVGVNAKGTIETYQTLPFDICCRDVGSGKKSSYNYNPQARVQLEMCEDVLKDAACFNAVMKEVQEFCAYLCKLYGFGVDKISSHHESYLAEYGGNHGDLENRLKPFGKTMNCFRAEVQKLLDADKQTVSTETPSTKLYRVQAGAYSANKNVDAQLKKIKAAEFDAYMVKVNDFTKKAVVKTCVQAVEQLYKDLHGEEKYNKVVESVTDMLNEKGITITDIEMKMLIETVVGEFNNVFGTPDEDTKDTASKVIPL